MIPKNKPERLARLAKQRRKIREEKAILHLADERQKLNRVLWEAPLVDLEKPYQRGWYREFELTEAAKRRKDAGRLIKLLSMVNRVETCRHGKFLSYDQDLKKRVPKKHGLKSFRLREFKKLDLPDEFFRYFRLTGTFRPVTREVIAGLSDRWSGKVVVRCPQLFASVTKPLIITQQRVDMPQVRSRIDEIENYFEQTNGWGRYRNLRGQSWRWYDYTTSFWRRREQQELKEMKEGTTDVVPFCLLGERREDIPVLCILCFDVEDRNVLSTCAILLPWATRFLLCRYDGMKRFNGIMAMGCRIGVRRGARIL